MTLVQTPRHEEPEDRDLAERFAARDSEAVRTITARNNQRLFRAAWSILRNRSEAEDAVQTAYLRAFAAIDSFRGASSLSTWLTRIVINEALARRRSADRARARLDGSIVVLDEYREKLMNGSNEPQPGTSLERKMITRLIEEAVGRLPEEFRTVFVLREIEQLSVAETAEILAIPEATVKTRFLRARRKLQKDLAPDIRSALDGTFPFAGGDCEAMTKAVVEALCGAD